MEAQEADKTPYSTEREKVLHGHDKVDHKKYSVEEKKGEGGADREREQAEYNEQSYITLKATSNSHYSKEMEDNNGRHDIFFDTANFYQGTRSKIGHLTAKDIECSEKRLILPSLVGRFLPDFKVKAVPTLVSKATDLRKDQSALLKLMEELAYCLNSDVALMDICLKLYAQLSEAMHSVQKNKANLSKVYVTDGKKARGEDAEAQEANKIHKKSDAHQDRVASSYYVLAGNINDNVCNGVQKFEVEQSKYSVAINTLSYPGDYYLDFLYSFAIRFLDPKALEITPPPKKVSNLFGQKGGDEDSLKFEDSSEDSLSNFRTFQWDKNSIPSYERQHTPAYGHQYTPQMQMARKMFPDRDKDCSTTTERITLRKQLEEQEPSPRSFGQTQANYLYVPKLEVLGLETEGRQVQGGSDSQQAANSLNQQDSPSNDDLVPSGEMPHHQNQTTDDTYVGTGADSVSACQFADYQHYKGLLAVSPVCQTEPESSGSLPANCGAGQHEGNSSPMMQEGARPHTRTHENEDTSTPSSASVTGDTSSPSSSVRVHAPVAVSSPTSSEVTFFQGCQVVCQTNRPISCPTPFADNSRTPSPTERQPGLAHPVDEHGPSSFAHQWSYDASALGSTGFTPGSDDFTCSIAGSSTSVVSQEQALSSSQTSSQDLGSQTTQACSQGPVESCNRSHVLSSNQSNAQSSNQSQMQIFSPPQVLCFSQSSVQTCNQSHMQSSSQLQLQSSSQSSSQSQLQSSSQSQLQSSNQLQLQSSSQSQVQSSSQSQVQTSTQPHAQPSDPSSTSMYSASRPLLHVGHSRAEEPHNSSAPRRLPPVIVHAAGSLPPRATNVPRINVRRAHNRQFLQLNSRRATYDDSWLDGTIVEPADMSLAGFYYIGPGRRVQCFYCGLELVVRVGDNIWDLHVQLNPNCAYLVAIMGREMLELTQRHLNKK